MSHGQEPGTPMGPARAGHHQHLLGRKPVGREVFRGYGRTAYLDQQNTDYLLRRLATQMKNAWLVRGKGLPGEQSPLANLRIPAGYTYLGQLVAHDLSFPSPLPEIFADTGTAILPATLGLTPDTSSHRMNTRSKSKMIAAD